MKSKNWYTLSNGQTSSFMKVISVILKTARPACAGVDYVLHQAALGSVPRSIADPITTNAANITGFLNMLTAARDARVKSFTYAASSSPMVTIRHCLKLKKILASHFRLMLSPNMSMSFMLKSLPKTYGFKNHWFAFTLMSLVSVKTRVVPDAAVIPKWTRSHDCWWWCIH